MDVGKRKICVVITARPSYSRIKTALTAIRDHEQLELQLVVAASALLDRYGNAVRYIEKDGFELAARVYNVLEGENLVAQAKTTGLGIIELANVFMQLEPDAVVTIADRFETMSTAVAASYMNIPLVHIQGGEVTGNIDEKVRHAITKLSDLHLVSSQAARERVIKMGENPEMVFCTGCPSIDIADQLRQKPEMDFDPYRRYGGVGGHPPLDNGYCVVMQHPVTSEYEKSRKHVEETLHAICELKVPTLWFWPNVDAGADGTSRGIRSFREYYDMSHVHFFKNMEPHDFLKVLKNSQCLLGNSSVGIRECSFLGIPVINIGTRQAGRQRGANVIDVPYDRDKIKKAFVRQSEHGHYESDQTYGDGKAAGRIADLLAKTTLSFTKKIQY